MSESSTFARRTIVARKIQDALNVRVEAVHPNGPIGIAYIVGYPRKGVSNAAEARRVAREESARERWAQEELAREELALVRAERRDRRAINHFEY